VRSRVERALGDAVDAGLDAPTVTLLAEQWASAFTTRGSEIANVEAALDDLRRWLRPKRRGRPARAAAKWLGEHATFVLPLAAAAGSAILGLAYTKFYGSFGVTSDDVGVGPSRILADSVLGCLALIEVFTVLFPVLIAPFVPLFGATTANAPGGMTHGQYAGFLICYSGVVSVTQLTGEGAAGSKVSHVSPSEGKSVEPAGGAPAPPNSTYRVRVASKASAAAIRAGGPMSCRSVQCWPFHCQVPPNGTIGLDVAMPPPNSNTVCPSHSAEAASAAGGPKWATSVQAAPSQAHVSPSAALAGGALSPPKRRMRWPAASNVIA
jgi:hypothetical protein